MPLFGAHMSIAGGLYKAVLSAQTYGMETFQMFTSSPSQWCVSAVPAGKADFPSGKLLPKNNNPWNAKDLSADDLKLFHDTLKSSRRSDWRTSSCIRERRLTATMKPGSAALSVPLMKYTLAVPTLA